jgi:hypothetical protein
MQSMKQLLGLYFFLMFPRFQKFTGEKLSLPPQENKAKVTNKPLCFNPVENLHFLPQLPAAHRKKNQSKMSQFCKAPWRSPWIGLYYPIVQLKERAHCT